MFEKINSFKSKIVTRDYFLLVVSSIIVIVALYFYKYYSLTNHYSNKITEVTAKQSVILETEFKNIRSDIEYFLSQTLLDVLDVKHDDATEVELKNAFYHFMKVKKQYDQIRILDKNGQEVIRLNNGKQLPEIIPKEELQDKSEKYYFKEALYLGLHDIYISQLDLNKEHGNIEVPIKPMIRFIKPIYDKKLQFQGMLIFNYKAMGMLEQLKKLALESDIDMYMINKQGNIIQSPEFNYDWSFMYKDSTVKYISQLNEKLWNTLLKQKNQNEFFEIDDGFYNIKMYYPYMLLLDGKQYILSDDTKKWYIVLGKEKFDIEEKAIGEILTFVPYILIFLLSGVTLIWLLTKYRYKRKLKEDKRKIAILALRNTSKSVLITNKKYSIVETNNAFSNTTGFEQDEVLNKSLKHYIGNIENDEMLKKTLDTLAYTDNWEGVMWSKRKDDTLYPAFVSIDKINEKNGDEVEYYIIIFSDLTNEINIKKSLELKNEYATSTAQVDKFFHQAIDFNKNNKSREISPVAQLIVDIADEIDIPLGMIRNSSFGIFGQLEETLKEIFDFIKKIENDKKELFMEILTEDLDFQRSRCFLNINQVKKDSIERLEKENIEDATHVVELLLKADLIENIEKVVPLLQKEYNNLFVTILEKMYADWANTHNIEVAISKVSSVIHTLGKTLHHDSDKLSYNHLGRTIDDALVIFTGHAERDIKIEKKYGHYDEILCYYDRIQRIWTFIVKKALSAMSYKGSIRIKIEEDEIYQIVKIHYDADLLEEDIKENQFVKIKTVTKEDENFSLDYSRVKKIVEQHNGKIEIENNKSQGTTYSVYINKNLDKTLLKK